MKTSDSYDTSSDSSNEVNRRSSLKYQTSCSGSTSSGKPCTQPTLSENEFCRHHSVIDISIKRGEGRSMRPSKREQEIPVPYKDLMLLLQNQSSLHSQIDTSLSSPRILLKESEDLLSALKISAAETLLDERAKPKDRNEAIKLIAKLEEQRYSQRLQAGFFEKNDYDPPPYSGELGMDMMREMIFDIAAGRPPNPEKVALQQAEYEKARLREGKLV